MLPLIVGAIWLLPAIVRAAAAEHQRYRAWKASLTPQERMAVELAEAAAATATAITLWEHHKAVDARLTSSVMGYTLPDGHMMRPSDRLASYRQRAAMRHPAPGSAPSNAATDGTAPKIDTLEGARIWTGHGILAHNLVKIAALAS